MEGIKPLTKAVLPSLVILTTFTHVDGQWDTFISLYVMNLIISNLNLNSFNSLVKFDLRTHLRVYSAVYFKSKFSHNGVRDLYRNKKVPRN